MDGVFSRDKFEYVWRNISMDSSLLDEDFDNTVGKGKDGEFKRGQEQVEEVIEAKTVEEEEKEESDNSDNDNNSKVNKDYNDTDNNEVVTETVVEDNNNNDNDDDDDVDYKTITEEDYNEEEKKEKWYYEAKFMLDWVNKFSRMYCVHPDYAISIDEMMKLFKGRSNMTHKMKKKQIKEGFKFFAMTYSYSDWC